MSTENRVPASESPDAPPTGRRVRIGRVGLLLLLVGLFAAFLCFGGSYFNLAYLKEQQAQLASWYDDNSVLVTAVFFLAYVTLTGLSLPFATVLTLLGGFVFGRWFGTVVVSFASTAGSTLAFLASRHLIGNSVQERFRDRLDKLNRGFEREGPFFLFTLRLIPAVPFWLINLGMGLTRIRTRTFWWVSQIGMLPGTFVYVNAGTELGRIDPEEGLKGILTPPLIIAFVALGLFPLAVRWVMKTVRSKLRPEDGEDPTGPTREAGRDRGSGLER